MATKMEAPRVLEGTGTTTHLHSPDCKREGERTWPPLSKIAGGVKSIAGLGSSAVGVLDKAANEDSLVRQLKENNQQNNQQNQRQTDDEEL